MGEIELPGAGPNEKEVAKVHSLEITPALRDAAVKEGFPMFQAGEQGPRGQIRVGGAKIRIDLFNKADKSTFLHETGHAFLHVLEQESKKAGAVAGLKKDYNTILDYLGAKPGEALTTEQHEKWARSFETYLREGKAPTSALAAAFERFKAWLTEIYSVASKLDAPINDEVRGVMDSMLGGKPASASRSWLGAAADRYGAKAYYDVLGKLAKRAPAELGLSKLKDQHAALPLARALLADEPSAGGAKAAVNYTRAVASGEARVRQAIRATVEKEGTSLLHLVPSEADKAKIMEAVKAASVDPNHALKERNDLADHMPDNATALVAAKSRATQYLGGLQPKPITGLPFDEPYTSKDQERRYNRALEVAASPLVVMKHIKAGTLELDHVKDFNAMFPDLAKYVRSKVFEGVVSAKNADVKPSYSVRQGLSLLMGQPLDSTFTPASIAAAQHTFLAHQASKQPPPQVSKTKSHLSKLSGAYATTDQAAAARSKGGAL